MAVRVLYVYSTRTATVTVSYTDTLTKGGRGERVAVRVQFTVSCTDTLTEGGMRESGSYCVLHEYSDREWQYVYSLLCLAQIL